MHGYPKKLVDNQLRRVVENQQEQFSEHQKKHGTGVPLAVTYHPWFHDLGRIIYSYAEEQVKEVYTPPAPFALFQSGFSLTNHLVQAKAYPLLRETVKRFKKLTIAIVIVGVSFTFYIVKYVSSIVCWVNGW